MCDELCAIRLAKEAMEREEEKAKKSTKKK
jgi:hypothetical protein